MTSPAFHFSIVETLSAIFDNLVMLSTIFIFLLYMLWLVGRRLRGVFEGANILRGWLLEDTFNSFSFRGYNRMGADQHAPARTENWVMSLLRWLAGRGEALVDADAPPAADGQEPAEVVEPLVLVVVDDDAPPAANIQEPAEAAEPLALVVVDDDAPLVDVQEPAEATEPMEPLALVDAPPPPADLQDDAPPADFQEAAEPMEPLALADAPPPPPADVQDAPPPVDAQEPAEAVEPLAPDADREHQHNLCLRSRL